MQRILLVEDHPDVRVLLENVLVGAGYVLDVAETVAAARKFLAAKAYVLIVADGGLPDGTGIDVADEAAAAGLKTLLIFGNVSLFDKQSPERYEYLMKPVRVSELLSTVQRLVENS
jgi:DNA-binding NtrC family response regulator